MKEFRGQELLIFPFIAAEEQADRKKWSQMARFSLLKRLYIKDGTITLTSQSCSVEQHVTYP